MKKLTLMCALAVGFSFATGCANSQASRDADKGAEMASAKPYPLKTCLVMDDALDPKDQFAFVYKGQQIKLCCEGCREDFDKDPQKYLKKLAAK